MKISKRVIIGVCIVAAFVLLVVSVFISTNNRAISLEEQVFSAQSNIQVQEKRRTDLIYNLADCAMQYDEHEKSTLLALAEARSKGDSSAAVTEIQTSIRAVAEAYPELKSNENYKELMNELSTTENLIAEQRKSYTNEVRAYNKFVGKRPNKQILSIMGYEPISYTYLEYSEEETAPVTNMFGE